MKWNDDIDININIRPMIYHRNNIDKLIQEQEKNILEHICRSLTPIVENLLKRRLQEREVESD